MYRGRASGPGAGLAWYATPFPPEKIFAHLVLISATRRCILCFMRRSISVSAALSLRLPVPEAEWLAAEAHQSGRTMTETVRSALRFYREHSGERIGENSTVAS